MRLRQVGNPVVLPRYYIYVTVSGISDTQCMVKPNTSYEGVSQLVTNSYHASLLWLAREPYNNPQYSRVIPSWVGGGSG